MGFWKKNGVHIILSLLAASAVLATDINSRPYFAIGAGGMAVAGVVVYWICKLVEGGECNGQKDIPED